MKERHICWLPAFYPFPTMSSKGLTHYHTMPYFEPLQINSCRKHCDKQIFPFFTMFSTLYGTQFQL